MEIKFKLFGLTDVVGENEVKVDLPKGSSLQLAMHHLVGKYGDDLRQRLLKDSSHLQDYVRLVVEGRIVDRLEEVVEEGTTIFILHELAGG